jgi:hypothetical protein
MKGFEQLAEICTERMKDGDGYEYDIDNIFLDGVEYRVQLEHNIFKEFSICLVPTFAYRCGINAIIYMSRYKYEENFDKNTFLELFKIFKVNIKTFHLALHCESVKNKSVHIHDYDKEEYKAKIEFLKELNQEGTCYICHEPTLNTEHIKGCKHHIHLSCLYKYHISKNISTYSCGVCKKNTEWDEMFEESSNEEDEQDN